MLRTSPILLTFALLLAGCSVGPTFEPPTPALPKQWEAPRAEAAFDNTFADAEIDARWWEQFGDPLLVELVERAHDANMDIRLAVLRVAQSRAQREIVSGNKSPNVAASGSYQRQRQSEFGTGTRLIDIIGPPGGDRDAIIEALGEPYDVYQIGFDASWELDLWGRVRRAVESADASVAASAEDLHAARLAVAAEVARTYLELRGVQDQLRIAQADRAVTEDALELTQFRSEGGVVTQLDVVSQRARLADARARVPRLQQQERVLINVLGLLRGEEPGSLRARLAKRQPSPELPDSVALGIPTELARRRPDIRGAEARLHAATADMGVAVADLYPRITLTGGFLSESLEAGDLSEWGARQWAVGPSLHLPIFDGGRRRAVVELREIQQQEAAVNYQRTVLHAWHEIDNALSGYLAERRRNEELRAAVEASGEAHDIASVQYEHGLTNFLVALDAQRTMLQAERALSDSNTLIATQLVAIYKALGGGWEDAP